VKHERMTSGNERWIEGLKETRQGKLTRALTCSVHYKRDSPTYQRIQCIVFIPCSQITRTQKNRRQKNRIKPM
jgi:hypothetical protein